MTEKRYQWYIDGVDIWDNQKEERIDDTPTLLNELYYENEELKQFQEKVFTLLDKEISQNEETIEWGNEMGASTGAMGFYNHMLKRLQKELQE